MPTAKLSGLLQQFGRPATEAPDGELLSRFVATRDEPAFAELVRRYGPLVFAVCNRVIGSHHLAEDAFQAVFVVLATKAGSICPPSALPAWLHGVAARTALRARTVADRRRRREAPVEALPEVVEREVAPAERADLAAVVDEEIAQLTDALREVVVLCEIEGCSRKEASARIGVPEGTVSSRLAAARKALAGRLRSRGVALSAAGLSAALGSHATASVPAGLAAKALACVVSPDTLSAPVAGLSSGVLRVMFAQKLKTVLPLTAIAFGALACVALAASHDPADSQPLRAPKPAPAFVLVPRPSDPVPKAEPKPLPKGPNKLLIARNGLLSLIDPDGKNEIKIDEKQGKLLPLGILLAPDGKSVAANIVGPLPPDDGAPGAKRAPASLHVRKIDEKEPGTDLGVQCQTYVWSGDGTEIACSEFEDGRDKAPVATHFIVNVKTKAKTVLKLPGDHIITDWSRDGKHFLTTSIAVKDQKPSARLYLMNRDGTEHKALTDGTRIAMLGKLSPDGTRVLYGEITLGPKEKPGEQRRDLTVLDVATGKTAKVEDVPLNAELQGYCWSPDGKKIAYCWRQLHAGKPEEVQDKETETHLIVCDPDGKNAKTILTEKGAGQWHVTIGGMDWR